MVAAKLVTLGTPSLEIATYVGAVFVDCTRVRVFFRPVEHTTAALTHLERLMPKMSGFELVDDIQLAASTPSFDVRISDENGPCALKTASATGQAI